MHTYPRRRNCKEQKVDEGRKAETPEDIMIGVVYSLEKWPDWRTEYKPAVLTAGEKCYLQGCIFCRFFYKWGVKMKNDTQTEP